MSETIRDGTGSGRLVRVTDDNELEVKANSNTEEHITTIRDSDSYIAHTGDTANTLTVTATGGPMLFVRNDSSSQILIIQKLMYTASAANGVIVCRKNPTLGTIGNNNTHTPINLDFASSKNASVTAYNWNEVGNGMTGLSGGELLAPLIISAGMTIDIIDGAIVLRSGNSFSIEYSVAGGGEFSCAMRFYFDTLRG